MEPANLGDAFEDEVISLLGITPGIRVEAHPPRLAGKDVDALCHVEETLGGITRVAVECKDYSRKLPRALAAEILADYRPLLDQQLVNKVLVVSRNGVVANAKSLFSDARFDHLTYAELLERAFGPTILIHNMEQKFLTGIQSQTYVPANCYAPPLEEISRNYHLVYNQLMDLAVQKRKLPTLDYLRNTFHNSEHANELEMLFRQYSNETFRRMAALRKASELQDLEQVVSTWAEDATITQGLALLGSYGTGKSTFARRLACVWAKRYRDRQTSRIPFLIELREFGSHQDIEGLITHELTNRHRVRNGSFELFSRLNHGGKFLLILDGFDEMKEGLSEDVLLFNFNEINRLLVPGSKVLLCGRPTAFASQGEQVKILGGSADSHLINRAQYLQIQIAAFSKEETARCLQMHIEHAEKRIAKKLQEQVTEIGRMLDQQPRLEDLFARPVHLPMLIAVLPEWSGPLASLDRAALYGRFIDKIIAREIQKRRAEMQGRFSAEDRRFFARRLAAAMYKQGQTRSIRFSSIPESVVAPFVRAPMSSDSTKRDLVAACFLERKSPDILFFAHKSFGEFLVADFFVSELRDWSNTDELGVSPTPEIISFLLEMLGEEELSALFRYPTENTKILELLLSSHRNADAWKTCHADPAEIALLFYRDDFLTGCEAAWQDLKAVQRMKIWNALESASGVRKQPDRVQRFLRFVISGPDQAAAVHAFRALANTGLMSDEELRQVLDPAEFSQWVDKGWLKGWDSPGFASEMGRVSKVDDDNAV